MSVIAFLKKENESAGKCEINKFSEYVYLDEKGDARVGLELILKNESEEMQITGIRIVVPDKIKKENIVEKSNTFLNKFSPWNTRYSEGYELINNERGEVAVGGENCYVIGLKDKRGIDESYNGIKIIEVDFKNITSKGLNAIPPKGAQGVFRMIIPFESYANEVEETWNCTTFLNYLVRIPDGFKTILKNDLKNGINQIIKINKKSCDIHIVLPPRMIPLYTSPTPGFVTPRPFELFENTNLELKREGISWRARLILKESTKYMGVEFKEEKLVWDGILCYCSYWRPITREWLTETITDVIKRETKNALNEYIEKLLETFK